MATKSYTVLGLMSGTSLDGLDMAICRFDWDASRWHYQILAAQTDSLPHTLVSRIQHAKKSRALDLMSLHAHLGQFIGASARNFLQNSGFSCDFVCSHGQTIFHQPEFGVTTQIGDPAYIAALTELPVVADFRSVDIALGGNGAPLVPVGDALLFPSYDACVNLGGFANLSYPQPGNAEPSARLAFDCCPFNTVANYFASQLGKPFDASGHLGSSGQVITPLLERWNSLDFYQRTGPKSLGTEWLEEHFLSCVLEQWQPRDLLRTFYAHAAYQLGRAIPKTPGLRVLVTGGGAYNTFFIDQLKAMHPALVFEIPDPKLIEFKEALIFAFLGVLRWRNEINVWKSVTGSSRSHSAGAIYHP
ncbi:MAG TPA: anhydro-N-acetylmuramic acid kinase [Luteibaculaceae bacterium]|nr:anhydro-N-acetylmuramic acid kinase [Luteibaculaceae bacterium]